jgi:hypothetical protein
MRYRTRAGVCGRGQWRLPGPAFVRRRRGAEPRCSGRRRFLLPGAGNGGYDVAHYDIRPTYQPATDLLSGTTTILAKTTQEMSRFNLDFGLKVQSFRVNNAPAKFATDAKDSSELVVTPAKALRRSPRDSPSPSP